MQRIIRTDESEYFNYRFKKKEMALVKKAYQRVNEDYEYFLHEWKRLRRIGRKAHEIHIADDIFWKRLEGAFMYASWMKQYCNFTDPYGEAWSTDDDRWTYTLDVTLLYNLLFDLRKHADYLARKTGLYSPICDYLAEPLNKDAMKCYGATREIDSQVTERILKLYRSLLETFCKLCVGDTLFTKMLAELDKAEVPTIKSAQKRKVA